MGTRLVVSLVVLLLFGVPTLRITAEESPTCSEIAVTLFRDVAPSCAGVAVPLASFADGGRWWCCSKLPPCTFDQMNLVDWGAFSSAFDVDEGLGVVISHGDAVCRVLSPADLLPKRSEFEVGSFAAGLMAAIEFRLDATRIPQEAFWEGEAIGLSGFTLDNSHAEKFFSAKNIVSGLSLAVAGYRDGRSTRKVGKKIVSPLPNGGTATTPVFEANWLFEPFANGGVPGIVGGKILFNGSVWCVSWKLRQNRRLIFRVMGHVAPAAASFIQHRLADRNNRLLGN